VAAVELIAEGVFGRMAGLQNGRIEAVEIKPSADEESRSPSAPSRICLGG
jgi:hypothetical protein